MGRAKQISQELDEISRRPYSYRKKDSMLAGAVMHVTAPAAANVSVRLREHINSEIHQGHSSSVEEQGHDSNESHDDQSRVMTSHARRVRNRVRRHVVNSISVTPTMGPDKKTTQRDWNQWNPGDSPSKPSNDLISKPKQVYDTEGEGEVAKFDGTFANYWREVDSKLSQGIKNAAGKLSTAALADISHLTASISQILAFTCS